MKLAYKREIFDSDEDLNKLINLQNIVYKGKHQFSIDSFRYWYINNPQGRVYSFSAYDGELMVANYSCIPTKLSIDGRIYNGVHSMGVVTHPNYRGLGLFSKLGNMASDCAKKEGKEFVMAISNANSTQPFLKNMGFYLISPLDVLWGFGKITCDLNDKRVFKVYDQETLKWRLDHPKYSRQSHYVYGTHIITWGIKTFMGQINKDLLDQIDIRQSNNFIRPLTLYIGLGADLTKGHYYKFPKFVKHSPFNLIFKDLTEGTIPKIKKEDVLIQLIDYDVT